MKTNSAQDSHRRSAFLPDLFPTLHLLLCAIGSAHLLGAASFGHVAAYLLLLQLLTSVQHALVHGPQQLRIALGEPPTLSLSVGGLFAVQFTWMLLAGLIVVGINTLVPLPGLSTLALLTGTWMYLFHAFYTKYLGTASLPGQALKLQIPALIVQLAGWWWFSSRTPASVSAPWWILGMTFLSSLIRACYVFPWRIVRFLPWRYLLQRHWRDGKWLLVSSMLQWWAFHILIVVAGVLLGIEVMGVLQISLLLWGLVLPILPLVEQDLYQQAHDRYHESSLAARQFLFSISRRSSWIVLAFAALMCYFSADILKLAAGPDYGEYAFVLQGISVLHVLIILSSPIRVALKIWWLDRSIILSQFLTVVFSLLLGYWAIQYFQLKGMILLLLINQVLMIIYWIQVLRSRHVLIRIPIPHTKNQ